MNDESEDALAAARGTIVGCIMAVPFWLLLVVLA
jgi:hypothetical protein